MIQVVRLISNILKYQLRQPLYYGKVIKQLINCLLEKSLRAFAYTCRSNAAPTWLEDTWLG
jgi:hypothetical protein